MILVSSTPIGYFINIAEDGNPPHYMQVSEKHQGNPDVVPLYAAVAASIDRGAIPKREAPVEPKPQEWRVLPHD